MSACSSSSLRDFSRAAVAAVPRSSHTFLVRYEPPELQPLIDDDVAEAAAALAATFETASRGVIYEHRPASLPAERLATALKPVLAEAGKGAGRLSSVTPAVVLRRVEEAVRERARARAGRIAAHFSICSAA